MLVYSLLLAGLSFRAVLAQEAGTTATLAKRGLADDYSAVLSLVESAANAVANSTSCAAPCERWMTGFGECSALQEELKVAECACAAGKVKLLDTCAGCLGEEAEGQANSFDNFCVQAKTQLGGSTTSITGGDSAADDGSSSESSGTSNKSAADGGETAGGETAGGENSAVTTMTGRSGLLVAAMAGVIAVVAA